MAEQRKQEKVFIWDDLVMIALALISGYLLLLQYTTNLTSDQQNLFNTIDLGIAIIFLLEFAINFLISKSRAAYFKSNWWYLLASIPITNPATQALRLLRLLRLVRLFRLRSGFKEVFKYLERFVEQTHILYVISSWLIIVLSGTVAFYIFEHSINVHVQNLFDSLWWVMSTITTVGYGDIYPVTTAGRIVGIILMIVGIGTSGVFTALIASFFIRQERQNK